MNASPGLFANIVAGFLGKKRIIGWVAAVLMAVGGASMGMKTAEFKEAVCGAPVIEEQK